MTAEKLDAINGPTTSLLKAPDASPAYGRVAELAYAIDDVGIAEIENWQAVFGGKHINVPL